MLRSRPIVPTDAFSVIELVLVLVIVALLAAIAIPRVGGSIARERADAAAARVAADLALARNRARTTSQSVTVLFDTTQETYRLVGVADPTRPGSEYRIDLAGEPYLSDLVSADFGGDATIVFDIYGVPDSGGDLYVRAGEWVRRVVVQAETGVVDAE
jgi:type II secretory pathway pseudopilin PulG